MKCSCGKEAVARVCSHVFGGIAEDFHFNIMGELYCSVCGELLLFSEHGRAGLGLDWLMPICGNCLGDLLKHFVEEFTGTVKLGGIKQWYRQQEVNLKAKKSILH